jgi:hypothetical protein
LIEMQPIHRIRSWSFWRVAVLIGGLWISQGCGKRQAPPILDADSSPIVETPDLEFDVAVEPQQDDPRQADVWISTSHPAVWKSLPVDPTSPDWGRLVAVRPQEDADQLPLDRSTNTSTSPGLKGEYAIVEGRLRYRLAEPLRAGAAYRVEFYRSTIPGFDVPGAPPTLPIVHWHVVPEPKDAVAQ